MSYSNFIQELQTETYLELLDVRDEFEAVINSQSLVLRELATFIGENPKITQDEFSARVQNIRGVHPSVINIAAAPDLVISLVHPIEGNEPSLGLDYRESAEQSPEVEYIIETGDNLITDKITLAQGGTGMVLRAPVYVRPQGTLNTAQDVWGIVSVVLDYERFLQSIGVYDAASHFDLAIFKLSVTGEHEDAFFGDPAVKDRDAITIDFDFPFGNWHLHATPKGGWPETSPTQWRERAILFLVGSSLLSLLAYIISLSEARRRDKTLLSNGIAALDDGFVMFDADDRLILSNDKYRQIYNLPDSVLRAGTPYIEIFEKGYLKDKNLVISDDQEDWFERREQARRDGAPINIEQHFSDGRVIKLSDRPMPDGSYVGLCVDITELSKAKAAAETSNRAKTDFMGVLSHELRTPLTVVLGVAHLAKNAKLLNSSKAVLAALDEGNKSHDELQQLVDKSFTELSGLMTRVVQSGDHLLHLINEMLDVAKIESGSLTVNPNLCAVGDIIGPVSDQLQTLSHKKGLEFEVTQDSGSVYVDIFRTRQILFNLVGNAIKFTEAGFVHLIVKVQPDNVVFEVRDSGPGISEEEFEAIFESFYQIDSSATRRAGGTGMGLAISRKLAELQGGCLTVSSEEGVGSSFKLTVPGAAGEAANLEATT